MELSNKFLYVLSLVFSFLLLLNNGVQGFHKVYRHYQSVSAVNISQVHRTSFHFQPKQNWINDPNGPMYYKGLYHLFYQYNPKGAVWGNIVWAHSVSTDMINWTPLEPAIYPSEPFDIFGCWSGSVTILPGNRPIMLYTGIVDPKPDPGKQVQNYALPANYSDPYLRQWVKPSNNPILVATTENVTAFRDPTTAWFDNGHWKMLVGSKRYARGMAYLYRSRDFMRWTKAKHPFHSRPNSGMWECPDFYPVPTTGTHGLDTSIVRGNLKHVFKVSLDDTKYEYYTLGTYLTNKDRYLPDNGSVDEWNGLRYDYGTFYASKTFFDSGKNRRILWGWANESDTSTDDNVKGWAGIQAIPRSVWLDPNGKQLLQWPIQELETLRGQKVQLSNVKLNKGQNVEVKGITAAQADVDVTFSFSSLEKAEAFDPKWESFDAQKLCSQLRSIVVGGVGPFGLLTLASNNLEEYTPVFFRIFKAQDNHKVLMCSDASSSSLRTGLYKPSFAGFVDVDLADKKISLRSLVDHSVVESFGAGGKTCITSRVYPTLAVHNDAHLYAFNNGLETVTVETLDAWSMKRPQMN